MAMPAQSDQPPNAIALLDRAGDGAVRRFIDVGGGALAYADIGAGDTVVVLIHGALTVLDDMLLALEAHLAGFRVIAFDRPGFGKSARRSVGDAGIFRQADGLNQALDELGVEQAVLVGHSFGGAVATAMAMARPKRAIGVVALATLAVPELRLDHILFGPRGLPLGGGAVAGLSHGGVDRALLPALWRAMFLPQSMPETMSSRFPFALAGEAGATSRVGEDCLASGPDLLAILAMAPLLETPLQILGGAADLVINNHWHGRVLAALAPHGQFSLLPGVGHMIHHAEPARVRLAINDVLAAARR